MVVMFGLIPATNTPLKSMGGLTVFSVYFPVVLTFAMGMLALLNLPRHLADYRQQGILRRLGTTPVPPAWMLAAQVAINLALAVAALVILVVAGTVGFGLGAPRELGGFTLALALSIAALFAIGLWISAIARSQNAANAIGQLLLWPMLFLAGLFVPRPQLPAVLRDIGDWTPLAPPCTRCATPCSAPSHPHNCCSCWLGGGVRVPGRALLTVGVAEAACCLSGRTRMRRWIRDGSGLTGRRTRSSRGRAW
jgi:ABC-2 type transport system permease protein